MRLTARRRRRLLGVAVGIGSLLLTACGSTVAGTAAMTQSGRPSSGTAGLEASGGNAADGGNPAGTAVDAAAAPTTALPNGPGGQASGPAAPTGGAISGQAGSAARSGTTRVAVGPGVTATTILLGIPYCSDCAAANSALGVAGTGQGDPRDYYKAMIADVNSRGGVLGRKLVPLFHNISASQNFDVSSQEVCADFTEDHKVFVIYNRGEISANCALKAGIMNVGSLGAGPTYARFPNVFAPDSAALERLSALTVRAMVKAGWEKPDTRWPTGKIGIVTWDIPDYHYAVDHGALPALHAAGLKESDVRYVAVPQSDKSLADASAAVSAAVLSFRDKGIDHVLIGDGSAGIFAGGGLTLTFLQSANSQHYNPRYGFNTNNFPGASYYPQGQQTGMLAVDSLDGSDDADVGIAKNPQRNRCIKTLEKAGLTASGNDAVNACVFVSFMEVVLKRAKGTLLPDVIAAAESVGTSYRSPIEFGNRIDHAQHDGTALFRNSRFDDPCACMKYTSKPYEP